MSDLRGSIAVRRHPLWTDRKIINGIIDLPESKLDDAALEAVILAAMNDIKTWLIAQNLLDYLLWVEIADVPRAIIRATSFAAAASVYARGIYAPVRVFTKTGPVTANFLSDLEVGMEYWESKMHGSLENYRVYAGDGRLRTDTQFDDPFFTMDDLPHYS